MPPPCIADACSAPANARLRSNPTLNSWLAGGGPGSIQISQLPPRLRLDAPWPRFKAAQRGAPRRIVTLPNSRLYAAAFSRQVAYQPFLPEEPGGEPQASFSYALADAAAKARGTMEGHEVRLLAPGALGALWRRALLPGEAALSLASVQLRDAGTGLTVPLLALGAGLAAGEDYPCGGRVLLFRVTAAAPGHGAGSGWAGELVAQR